MEFLEGETLADRLARAKVRCRSTQALRDRDRRLPTPSTARIARASCIAISSRQHHADQIGRRSCSTSAWRRRRSRAVAAGGVSMLPTAGAADPHGARARSSARSSTWRPSRSKGARPTRAPTSSRSAACSTRWSRGSKAFEGKTHASRHCAPSSSDEPPPVIAAATARAGARRCDRPTVSGKEAGRSVAERGDSGERTALGCRRSVGRLRPVRTPSRDAALRDRDASSASQPLAGCDRRVRGRAIAWRYSTSPTRRPPRSDLKWLPPPDALLSPAPVASAAQLALSPDGRHLVFVAARARRVSTLGSSAGWRAGSAVARHRGRVVSVLVARQPFPRVFRRRETQEDRHRGRRARVLCDAPGGRGGAWSPDGTIVFAGRREVHCRKSPPGRRRRPTRDDVQSRAGATGHYWPQFLPDGRHFLFYQISFKPEYQGIYVASLDSAETTRVVASTGGRSYASGYLLLCATVSCSPRRSMIGRSRREAKPCKLPIASATSARRLAISAVTVSPAGVLAYGPSVAMTTSLQWRDRDGATTGSAIAPGGVPFAAAVFRSEARRGDEVGARNRTERHLGDRTGPAAITARDIRSAERLVSCLVA